MAPGSLLDLTVRELLDAVAADSPAPAGGAVAALGTALAAALAGMTARITGGGFADRAATADALRRRAGELADADGAAYEEFLATLRLPREPDPEARGEAVRAARSGATEVPTKIGEVAAAVARLAADLAGTVKPNLRGDAVAGALVAAAAAGIAVELVETNVGEDSEDPRLVRVRQAAATARSAVDRAGVRASR
jgi:formiminotetrahydrofolate cyclodeaminase